MDKALEVKLKGLPRSPGVYFHKSRSGEIIYVGKAAVLRNRVRQYFQDSRGRDAKTMALVSEIHDTDWVETESEIDALFLESEMVKRYMPRYNVLLRDDKSQIFVRIDMKSVWPYVSYTRGPLDDGAEYFGPFYNGYALKNALGYLRSIYPYFVREPKKTDSKLEAQIGLNPTLHAGPEVYKANLRKLISYIKGNRVTLMRELESDMKQAAKEQRFEDAALLRNKFHHMKELQRRVMFGDHEFVDISKDRALSQLTELLGLRDVPRRIEGYDISHMSGTNVVASMVVFTNGVSDRAEYRKFKMVKQTNDDTANIHDTVFRRLGEKNIISWGKPDLILIDGGKGQLEAAISAQVARSTKFPVISIAKKQEEMIVSKTGSNISLDFIQSLQKSSLGSAIVTDDAGYYIINLHPGQFNAGSHSKNLRGRSFEAPSDYSDTVKLFQRIRDEAHRFAVSYHSTLKRSSQTTSKLDGIPGIGPATRKKLLRVFGSVKGIKQADESQIAKIVGPVKAAELRRYL